MLRRTYLRGTLRCTLYFYPTQISEANIVLFLPYICSYRLPLKTTVLPFAQCPVNKDTYEKTHSLIRLTFHQNTSPLSTFTHATSLNPQNIGMLALWVWANRLCVCALYQLVAMCMLWNKKISFVVANNSLLSPQSIWQMVTCHIQHHVKKKKHT